MKLKPLQGMILLILCVALPLFGHLSELPIQLWDEGRLAMKALEMSTSDNWIVTTVNGRPDMLSVKPPLLTWIQAIFIKIIGPNELAIRLPSALAGLATCLLIYWFFTWKYIKDAWLGIICNLLLITSLGFVMLHGTRSGDYDTMLTLLTTGYVLFFFLYLEDGKPKYLNMVMVLLLAAIYTKGVQGVLFLPALLLYTLVSKKMRMLLKEKWFYIGVALVAGFTVGFYVVREHYNAGYFEAVKINELGGRYGQVVEGHREDFLYFFKWIDERAFTHWYPALIAGIVAAAFSTDTQVRRLVLYLTIVLGSYMLVISGAQTKCWWYIMPAVPYMAIVAGIFIHIIFRALGNASSALRFRYNVLPVIFLITIISAPYIMVLKIITDRPSTQLWDYVNGDMTTVLYNVVNNNDHSLDGYLVLGNYEDNVTWYAAIIKKQHKPIAFVEGKDPGDARKVIAFRQDMKDYIERNYKARVTYSFNSVYYYDIEGKK